MRLIAQIILKENELGSMMHKASDQLNDEINELLLMVRIAILSVQITLN